MKKKKSTEYPLKGKSIALVGLGSTYADFVNAKINSNKFDEVWGINSIGAIFHVDRTFMMDPASRFLDSELAGSQTGVGREFLSKNKAPIYSCQKDKRVPAIELYPLEDVVKKLGFCYFNNTVAYAVAFGVYSEVASISFYGIDFTYKSNVSFAEAGRACVEFWCAIGVTKGIKMQVSQNSSLLDSNVPENEKLYGYHRLEDPLVQRFSEEGLMIVPQTSLKSPEPEEFTKTQQTEGVLIGRHDIEGVTYRANGRA
jgi:hypothetical protein